MWQLTELHFSPHAPRQFYACDGRPLLNTPRSPDSALCRIVMGTWGVLDIEARKGRREPDQLIFNGVPLEYEGKVSLALSIERSRRGRTTLGARTIEFDLRPLPPLPGPATEAFREMLERRMVPYPDPPSGEPKSTAEIQALAERYFTSEDFGFDKAMALYDWTTAGFIRQDLYHQLAYTAAAGRPLDLKTMARVIWGCDYPGYSAKDANFMHSFLMRPARNETEVYRQLVETHERVRPLAMAEMNVMEHAILDLPPISTKDYPELYRGAMPLRGGYDTGDFAPSLFEFPGNAGPVDAPLVQPLRDALEDSLRPGKIITTKGPWSFSNDREGAEVWQNGILITCRPPEGFEIWPGAANITPFSLDPDTFEINMPPPTRYRIDAYEWIELKGCPVCHFRMTHLGYCVEPLEAEAVPPEIIPKRTVFGT